MKKWILSIFIMLAYCVMMQAQCPTGDISFTSQQQINNFAANYPGCTEIPGGVLIDGNTLITSLAGLSQLTSVGGNLEIELNFDLTTLSGLDNITTVGGNLKIYRNPITALTGLGNLTSIGGDLEIVRNNSLTTLSGLENLTAIGGDFWMDDNDDLTTLNSLNNLTTIGGNLWVEGNESLAALTGLENISTIDGNLQIERNFGLTDFTGLENITSVGQDLKIRSNANLTTLIGLENITAVGGNLSINSNRYLMALTELGNVTDIGENLVIYSNDSLTTLTGLEGINNVGGSLIIGSSFSNNNLTTLIGLENITTIGGRLVIENNDNLLDLNELGNITDIGESVELKNNDALSNLNGLSNLTIINNDLRITGNSSLIVLDGLNQITSIGGGLHITSNSALNNLDGLSQITSVGEDLHISSNPALSNFDGLNQLTSIGGGLGLIDNSSMINLDGLNQITSLGEYLWIGSNTSLTNLDGLNNLTSINGHLDISYNDVLNDISGLELDTFGITNILIRYNTNLSLCNSTTICNYIQNEGTISISDNASGCNNPEEVTASCNSSPSCSDDLIIFNSQAQIDNFAINNPNCTVIAGDVNIINSTDISNLNGLNQITSIEGDLWVDNNTLLTDFAGLENLTSIGGVLYIASNPMLSGFAGFDNLDYSTMFLLTVEDNAALSTCNVEGICTRLQNGGTANFSNNASACNTIEEVSESCGLPLVDNQCELVIDNTFADDGTFLQEYDWEFDIYNGYSGVAQYYISDLATMPDGRIFGIGFVGRVLNLPYFQVEPRIGIFALTSSGELDYIRQPPGQLHSSTIGQIVASNGHLIYSSSFNNLSCFDPDNPDVPCFESIDFGSSISKLTVQTDGKILIGTISGGLSRYLPDGTADADFNGNVGGATGEITDIDVLQNGQIIITRIDGITRLNSDGTMDTSFGINGFFTHTGFDDIKNQFVELPTGDYAVLSGTDLVYVSPLGTEIATNPYFDPPGEANPYIKRDMLALPSGEILIASNDALLAYQDNYLAIIDTDGTASYTLTPTTSLAFQGNKVLVGGFTYGYDPFREWSAWVSRYECDNFGKIHFSTFYDINQNKIQDIGEPKYNDAMMLIESNTSAFSQNQLSVYPFSGESGNYTISYEQDNSEWELTTDSISYVVSLQNNENDTLYFGLHPNELVSDIRPTIASPPVRCNEIITFDINTKNLGTTIADGTLWLEVDENILTTNFIDTPDTTVTPNRYGWFFSDLFPSQSIDKQIDLQIPGPPDFPLGDLLSFNTYSNFEDENGTNTSPTFTYSPEVRCSYDPNDKLVNPGREGDYALFDENLIYTVRFQNTGNDVAFDVVIRDTLDTNLDLESFRLLGSSHTERLNTQMSDDGILTFEFRDIFLPDSTSDFEGSQGYVSYLIRTLDGLAEETPVTNSAGIYFDLNPPIITNTTQSIMVSELPTVSVQSPDNELVFEIIPNPNPGIFHVQGITNAEYRIFNSIGQILHSGQLNNDALIDVSQATSGIYFIEIRADKQIGTQRFIKQ